MGVRSEEGRGVDDGRHSATLPYFVSRSGSESEAKEEGEEEKRSTSSA
jgi:hypothetical protein